MINYQFKNMVEKPQAVGTKSNFPVIFWSPALERSYLAELRRLLKAFAKSTRELIYPVYSNELTRDADESTFEALKRLLAGLLGVTNETVKRLLEADAIRHTEQFGRAARKAFGVDLRGIINTEELQTFIDRAALRNAGLVKGMTDDLIKNIQRLTTDSLIAGETVGQLQKKLKQQFDITDSRAKLIASDQTSKLNAELNEIRHVQAGINEYTWRTSKDERVRKKHEDIDGETYKYGELTGAEQGLSPGKPIKCRCIAQGVVVF